MQEMSRAVIWACLMLFLEVYCSIKSYSIIIIKIKKILFQVLKINPTLAQPELMKLQT